MASWVLCSSVPALFSDHVTLRFHYSMPVRPATPVTHSRIVVPPKYCPTYISYMARVLPIFDFSSPDQLYSDLVSATHDCYKLYVSRPHLQLRRAAHPWTFDARIQEAREEAERDDSSLSDILGCFSRIAGVCTYYVLADECNYHVASHP